MRNYLKAFTAIAICLLCACQNQGQEATAADMPSSKTESSIGQAGTDMSSSKAESNIGVVSIAPSLAVQPEDGNKFSYILVRKEQTVLSRLDHSVCSSMYYEMPVVLVFDEELQIYTVGSDENAEIAAINAAFEQECHNFFENSAEFMIDSEDLATRYTDRYGLYHNELETQVTQCDESIFSVRQILNWNTYGLHTYSEFGLTFSLETGEQLHLDNFINMDYDTFHKTIFDFLFNSVSISGIEMKRNFYENIFSSFSDHTFFYKEGSLYIIFPALSNEDDLIVRWSIEASMPMECLYGTSF